jgi:hypothetical protein
MRVVLDRYSFSSLVLCAGGNNAMRHGMLHVVRLHVVGFHVMRVHVIARYLAHVHVRWGRTHIAVQFRGHAGHGNVRVVDIAFREVNTLFGLFEVFFVEASAIGIRVVRATVLGEVVGAGEGLIAQGADVRAFRGVSTDMTRNILVRELFTSQQVRLTASNALTS